jgi:DNA repair exonuclease SbcCD ATPase subunit
MEAPDPTPLLQCCVDQFTNSAAVVLENQHLRSELDRSTNLLSQLNTIQEQNAAIKARLAELEKENASLLNSGGGLQRSQPPEVLEKRYYEEREQDLLHQLSRANAQLRSQQTAHETALNQLRMEMQRVSETAPTSGGAINSGRALDIVQLEREISELRTQCATLERDNKQLKLGSIKRHLANLDDEGTLPMYDCSVDRNTLYRRSMG